LSIAENHLIELLPRKDRLNLLLVCEPVQLKSEQVLCEPGKPINYVYFPIDSAISLIALIDGSPGVEIGMVGREGMLGPQVSLGVPTAQVHALVQGPGLARRVATRAFRSELARSVSLQRSMNHYLYVRMSQMTRSSACLRFHQIGPRLARWLLMSQDRAHSDSFHVTHELLAHLLGVRRVGITGAASAMQRNGLIEYSRGDMKVLDRDGLEAVACGCYAADELSYAELF
jgi:CRP-like cAMP-binding protein